MISGGFSPKWQAARQGNQNTLGMMGNIQQQRYALKMQHDMNKKPKKTVGGALAAGAGMGTAGAMMGASTATPFGVGAGAAGGFAIGVASYYMS